jgi:integrase
MRLGVESLELKWKHVKHHRLDKKLLDKLPTHLLDKEEQPKSVNMFRVEGKTLEHEAHGYRNCIARINVDLWLDELKAITGNSEANHYLFCTPDGVPLKDCPHMFMKLLSYCELIEDDNGQNRSLYSIRHTYATKKIRMGIPYQVLAQQMGTSVEMIERHYSQNKIEEWAADLAA